MSEQLTAKAYLELLKKSQLVGEDQLKGSLKRLAQVRPGQPISLAQLSQHLLKEELVTEWQNAQLMAGKHKGFFLGQYRLLRLLGAGGMSAVYLAQQQITGNLRALKVLPKSRLADKSYLERFYVEGRAAAALRHPHIAQIVDLAQEGDVHYMVMEFIEGIDLDRYVKERGPLDYSVAVDFIRQAAEALQHAHSRNIVHRDIKPANLMVAADGKTVKLLDLGLALMKDQETSLTVRHNERVMGTADYLSPEQAIDSHQIDQRADIYSLGCTLHYLLIGQPPFPEGSIAQRIAKHQSVEPTPLSQLRPDCPLALERMCQKMMKKSPDDRFLDCRQLLDSLQKVQTLGELTQRAQAPRSVEAAPLASAKNLSGSPSPAGPAQPEPASGGTREPISGGSPVSPPAVSPAAGANEKTGSRPSASPAAAPAANLAATVDGGRPRIGPAPGASATSSAVNSPVGKAVASPATRPPQAATGKPTPAAAAVAPSPVGMSEILGDLGAIAAADLGPQSELSQLNSQLKLQDVPTTAQRVAKSLEKRARKRSPLSWGVSLLIVGMFTVLLVVLYVLSRYLQ